MSPTGQWWAVRFKGCFNIVKIKTSTVILSLNPRREGAQGGGCVRGILAPHLHSAFLPGAPNT